MVSYLLEKNTSCEVCLINVMRFGLSLIICLTNIALFQGFTNPITVWMGMASLCFVGELGQVVIDQGKKGVFGHSIRLTLTEINYCLTFQKEYPKFIPVVQYSVLSAIAVL